MNQNFSKLGLQLQSIWKQLGVSQRVSVLLATGVLVSGLGMLAFWTSRAQYGLLYGKLSEAEAAKVVSALDDAKVPYKIGGGGGSILVPNDKVHLMRMRLAERGIPKGEGVGFEIFDKPNFGISDFVQRANYLRAVQGELARTIAEINEVEAARVMIVMPENRLLLDKDKHPTASVFVRVRGNSQLQAQSINAIRFLVANAVEDLKPNNVSIVDNLGNALSENTDNDSLVGMTTSQLAARRNLEQYLSKKAQDLLEKVLGPGQAIVRVAAEINYDTITRTEEKYDPDGQVLKMQTKQDENTDSTTSTAGTPVGVASNTGPDSENATNSAAAPTPSTNSKTKRTTGTTQYEISRITSNVVQGAGGIRRLSAAVTVAARFEGTGGERKMVSRTPEELEKLRRIVQSALGIVPDTVRGDQVTLEELPFNDQYATELTQNLERQQRHEFWWNLVRNAVYPLLGIAALVVFVRLLRRTPLEDIPIGIPVGQLAGNGNGNGNGQGNGNGHGPGWQKDKPQEVASLEAIDRLIKANPSNMTHAIRSWLNRGKSGAR
jgi:flagellar M-ring protein FliF